MPTPESNRRTNLSLVLADLHKISDVEKIDVISMKLIDGIAIELKRLGRQIKDVPEPRQIPDDADVPPEDVSCG